MVGAFPRYVERDPLLLPDLIGELRWLRDDEADLWPCLEAAASSAGYLSRWASLSTTRWFSWDNQPETGHGRRLEAFYQRLADDAHPFVRTEAAHAQAKLHLGWEARALHRGERRRRYRALQVAEPRLPFLTLTTLTTLFHHFLHVAQMADYTAALLDAFAHYCHAHPYEPGTDVLAWARVFAVSSGALPEPD